GKEYIPPPRRYAKPGEEIYDPARYSQRHRSAKVIVPESVKLTPAQRQCALDAVVAEIANLPLGNLSIRPTAGVLKGEATKALHAGGFEGERIWSDGCHMKSKNDGKEFQVALKYVVKHVNEGAAVFIWPEFRGLVSRL